jgi:cysteinyl-tRNA synthetase
MAREINRGNDEGKDTVEACATLRELAEVLGLTLKEPEKVVSGDENVINQLIATRKQLRDARQFKAADEVRDKLLAMGVVLEDAPQGTIWKRKK